ncbi:MAG: ubiquitin-like small modifier protein SAMP2 [Halobacteriales archaeon]
MKLRVDVKNGDTHEVDVPEDAVYADVLEAVDLNPQAAVVVVDGRPVPETAEVTESEVDVLRTISGG